MRQTRPWVAFSPRWINKGSLYNLKADVSESRDLAGAEPARLKVMQAALDAWNAQLASPLWERERAAGQKKKKKA